ncbi:C6 transcription factor [Fusarium subglutinans]|uniref:C6 transcription factor n=1 Tax=Gibberella subglutinans TaxID=42677 RepID=A0A8H5Q499_GIBSU|nr:C6 transcription factor [Fusarium subglutinans]KAF5608397.1 C6 transcription factor [Fusarium subglutinans]
MARLKVQVKRSARRRRRIAQMRTIANGIDASPDFGTLDQFSDAFQDYRLSVSPPSEPMTLPRLTPTEDGAAFVSVYMDYVFPILYPFYRPYITQGGRTWTLSLAMKNTGFMSSIKSISALILRLIPAHVGPGQQACTSKTWGEIHSQASVALASMQRDLQHLHECGIENCLSSSVHLLANMMQQLSFELAIMPSGNWQAHLDAATNLFEQILKHHGKAGPSSQVSAVLSNLSHPSWPGAVEALNTEQGAFRFFSSLLVVADIISSTVLDQPAKLLEYHSELQGSDSRQKLNADLEEVIGCQNWVLLAISDISSLSRWKKDQAISGKLSKDELIYRATSLDRILNNGFDKLGQYDNTDHISQHIQPLESLLNQSRSPHGYSSSSPEAKLPLTRIWIHAARTYLLSVKLVNSTETSELEISVEQTIQSFGAITSSPWLRWLAWPLCVAGIYASKQQRSAISEIMALLSGFNGFGTIQAAFGIVEKTWQKRDAGEACLDLSACLGSLGYKALLL